MSNLSKISYNLEKWAGNFVSDLGKNAAFLPIILLEASVTGGRTYQAHKRGGFVEARERGTEETIGAAVWLGGVYSFNKMGEALGRKLFRVSSVDFEVGEDVGRNPLLNYLNKIKKEQMEKLKKMTPKELERDQKRIFKFNQKTLAAFKFTKIIASILLANAMIGFVVPKVNQAITRKYQKSLENLDYKNAELRKNGENFDGFANKTSNKDKKNTSFNGNVAQTLFNLTDVFENDARIKLLSTDTGTIGGRAINARNKYERREILFRDLSSLYFYYLCRGNLNYLLNFFEDGRTTRLDAVSAKRLTAHLRVNFKENSYDEKGFRTLVFGEGTEIPQEVQEAIDNAAKNKTSIGLSEFVELAKIKDNPKMLKRAELMSRLQPKIAGVSILTAEQAKDVYSDGLINDPRFLNKIFSHYTNKKSINPIKFVSQKELKKLKQQLVDYVKDIAEKAGKSGKEITLETLKKANRANFIKNALNLGVGFAVSIYFLSTAIPKIQYWLTKKQTGENKFPGVEKYTK
ncbi:MAG: hypothetical protein WCY19_05235 [Candidatus Gastranaerophilaceae bacterium]